MRVFVYFNLHKNMYSVRSVETGRVVSHETSVKLVNCKLKVSQAGRRRVLREKRKNVHAGVEGDLVDTLGLSGCKGYLVTYDPYKWESFVKIIDRSPVLTADMTAMNVVDEKPSVIVFQKD